MHNFFLLSKNSCIFLGSFSSEYFWSFTFSFRAHNTIFLTQQPKSKNKHISHSLHSKLLISFYSSSSCFVLVCLVAVGNFDFNLLLIKIILLMREEAKIKKLKYNIVGRECVCLSVCMWCMRKDPVSQFSIWFGYA